MLFGFLYDAKKKRECMYEMKQKGNEMQVTPEVQSTVLESKKLGPAVRFFIVHPSPQSSLYVLLRGGGLWGGGWDPNSFFLDHFWIIPSFYCIAKSSFG